jgi:hypothetical protein
MVRNTQKADFSEFRHKTETSNTHDQRENSHSVRLLKVSSNIFCNCIYTLRCKHHDFFSPIQLYAFIANKPRFDQQQCKKPPSAVKPVKTSYWGETKASVYPPNARDSRLLSSWFDKKLLKYSLDPSEQKS